MMSHKTFQYLSPNIYSQVMLAILNIVKNYSWENLTLIDSSLPQIERFEKIVKTRLELFWQKASS